MTSSFRRIARLFFAVILTAAGVAIAVPAVAMAAPQPSPAPTRWQIDLRPGPLRVAIVDVPEEGLKTYYYFTYLAINNSGQDLLFAPSFELVTDEDDSIRSGRDVPAPVVRELLGRLKNEFLEDEISIIGMMQQGEEYAKEGLVVWPAEDLNIDEVVIYASGFSGETRRVVRPDTGEEVILRKTMMLRHDAPGDLAGFGDRPLPRTVERWILR